MRAERRCLRRIFADEAAVERDILEKRPVARRIDHVHTAAEDRNHRTVRAQRARQAHRINALRTAGNDHAAALCHLIAQTLCLHETVGRCFSRADHGNDGRGIDCREDALVVKHDGRIVNRAQPRWILRVLNGHNVDIFLIALLQNHLCAGKRLIQKTRRNRRIRAAFERLLVRLIDCHGRAEARKQRDRLRAGNVLSCAEPDPVLEHPSILRILRFSSAT